MRAVLFLLSCALFAAVVANRAGCIFQCVGAGTTNCNNGADCGDPDTNTAACLVCTDGTGCDALGTDTCRAFASLGGACDTTTPTGSWCVPNGRSTKSNDRNYANNCGGTTCQTNIAPFLPGDSCGADNFVTPSETCFFGNLGVSSATCSSGTCPSVGSGSNCTGDFACGAGLFCNTTSGQCASLLPQGADCSLLPLYCQAGLGCVNGMCTTLLSVGSGGHCGVLAPITSTGGPADMACQVGLACDSSGTCFQPDTSKNGVACTTLGVDSACSVSGSTPVYCVNTSNPCSNSLGPLKCEAIYVTADSNVANAYLAYLQCMKSCYTASTAVASLSGAPYAPFSGSANMNCAAKKCSSMYQNYLNAIQRPSACSSAWRFVPAVFVVLAALMAVL